jgi:hypothetical protein
MGRRARITNESLILRFFKYLITKLPDRNVVFDVSKGTVKIRSGGNFRIQKTRATNRKGALISIKDPFLRDENHGYHLRDENNFNRLIIRMKLFIKEASQGRLEDFLIDADIEPEFETDKEKENSQEALENRFRIEIPSKDDQKKD